MDTNDKMEAAFWEFHENNPKIFPLFVEKTFSLIRSGRKFYGAKAIFEVIRFQVNIETIGSEFKINNNFISGYVRLFEATYPDRKGFFKKRYSRYDKKTLASNLSLG